MHQTIINFLIKNNLSTYPLSYSGVFRCFSSPFRVSPTFILIGASRCGTTAFYDYLTGGKYGYASLLKEIHFFDRYVKKGFFWYRSYFPTIFHRKIISGDATTAYIFKELVAQRISRNYPNIKLFVMLRDPIDRAFSHYHLKQRKKLRKGSQMPYSFNETMLKEINYLKTNNENIYELCIFLARGFYYEQLKVWEKYFPREQIMVIKSEDFFQEPRTVLKDAYKFLGYDIEPDIELVVNPSTSKIQMDSKIKEQLIEFYKPHNENLLKHWGIDFITAQKNVIERKNE